MVGSIYGIKNHQRALNNKEHEDLSFNNQQKGESDDRETKGGEKGDQSKSDDDDTMKSPSITAALIPNTKDSKRKIVYAKPKSFAGMKKRKSRNMEIEKKKN